MRPNGVLLPHWYDGENHEWHLHRPQSTTSDYILFRHFVSHRVELYLSSLSEVHLCFMSEIFERLFLNELKQHYSNS